MKIVRWIIGSVAGIFLLAVVAALCIFKHYDAGPPPISSSKALALLNNCYRFTHPGHNTRQAIAITHVVKLRDSSSNVNFADIQWRWTSGPETANPSQVSGTASFGWATVEGFRDWNFPESQWALMSFDQQGDDPSVNCTTPRLVR